MPSFPGMLSWLQGLQIPLPLSQPPPVKVDDDETKGSSGSQRHSSQLACERVRIPDGNQTRDDFAAALDFSSRFALDPMPVDERETESEIVHCEPRAAARLPRIKHAAAADLEGGRRQSCDAAAFFVAIHREAKTGRSRKEGNSAHLIRERIR